ncbi:hypothetical protein [Limosilactobacillus vaginalis]|uniref:hypothetical protein n=1 Tax=Limosilactobacillus vaginalis TaxID=1633 RepID=UPI0025A34B18|nr:hypothetical protein [Limosilactobacillus vaginalis]MDM8303701.1 hypothetical protein [Limosilactobacillus vaginalis]
MSIIPTISDKEAVKIAKTYIKQYHDYSLIAKRLSFMNAEYITTKDKSTHSMALYELKERENIINKVKQHDLTSGLIIEYRFIKSYSVNQTLEQLQHQEKKISERTLQKKQHEALLLVYSLIPDKDTKLIK